MVYVAVDVDSLQNLWNLIVVSKYKLVEIWAN